MISSYITPSKRREAEELAAMQATQQITPRQLAHGESGGKIKFQAGEAKPKPEKYLRKSGERVSAKPTSNKKPTSNGGLQAGTASTVSKTTS